MEIYAELEEDMTKARLPEGYRASCVVMFFSVTQDVTWTQSPWPHSACYILRPGTRSA